LCRIAGIVDKSQSPKAIADTVTQMCNLLAHGGPDDAGIYNCETAKLVLGHRRLALIDLSPLGHQPMIYKTDYVISFNGEIYNFPSLKSELTNLGAAFKTNSDTEVILAAFAQWGEQSFTKLKGMFAFALYDKVNMQLYLVRDPSGIKPLYYSTTTSGLQFASEIRAFSAVEAKKTNTNWPVFQMAYGHIPEPITTLANVFPLPKGCFLKYNLQTQRESLQSFSHYSYSSQIQDIDAAKKLIKDSTEAAVAGHLLSDAPIGVFLSGGIDSSVITSIASRCQHENLQTLSLYFNEAAFSEKSYQDVLIKKLHCKYYQHLLDETAFEDSFPSILQAMDMPSCDGVNTWFISKYAKEQGLKAVLSGIGGDELFGGYPSFSRMQLSTHLQKLPNAFLNIGKGSSIKRLRRLPYLQLPDIKGLYLFLRGQFTPVEIAQQLGAEEKEIWRILQEAPVYSTLNGLAPGNKASWMEMNMYMQNQLLRDADVMSMAHGIEIRVPLLADDLIRKAFSIAPDVKYKKGLPKYLLTDSFKTELPEIIFNRKKMGFSFPFTQWLSNSNYVKELMASSNAKTQRGYQKFLNGQMHWSNLMSLILLRVRNEG
jgi:asparagine synthase (glutamine-hydrolysing)